MTIEKLERPSRIDEERIQKLKELFPEAFADGKVNFAVLREEIAGLDEELLEENEEEAYGLRWVGKKEALRLAFTPPSGTLKRVHGEGVNEENTKNILIEGDNLEVLRLLQKSYKSSIKMIYIDPPYNTGDDFIYKDDFKDPVDKYLQKTKQADEEGLLTSNPKTSGRYHANWLNMMYPRLKLAKNLLKDDGVIFISIDEHEIFNLMLIMNEIFGEENFEGLITWRRRHNQPNDKTKMIGKVSEYILAYAKNSQKLKESGVGKIGLTGEFSNPDNDPRGDWASKPWKAGSGQSGTRYTIISPTGVVFNEEWMGDEETYKKLLEDGRIFFPKNGSGLPRKKYYKFEREEEGQCATNWWSHEEFGHNQGANDQLTKLFGFKNIFSNPKPTLLIKNLIRIANVKEDDIVLDFFAGSGTTGHAVFELNQEDLKLRNFILVQIPEPTPEDSEARKHGYENIFQITKERLARSISLLNDSSKDNPVPHGFSVYRLDKSNLRKWTNYIGDSVVSLEESLDLLNLSPFNDGWTEEDVVIELMLHQGYPLDSQIEQISGENTLWIVKHDNVPFNMIICLENQIGKETIGLLINQYKNHLFICVDDALSDQAKILLSETMKVKTI